MNRALEKVLSFAFFAVMTIALVAKNAISLKQDPANLPKKAGRSDMPQPLCGTRCNGKKADP